MNSGINYNHSISQLRQVIDTIDEFTNSQKCIDFLQKKTDEMIFLILSDDLNRSTILQIHDLSQLYAIFIYCETMPKDKKWTKIWTKIKGIFTDINKICKELKQETERSRRDSIAISISSVHLDHLDSSFMYTQLLKEILLEMEDDDKAKKELIEFYRKSNIGKLARTKVIDELEQYYHIYTPIWWYTRYPFVYDMINRALRLQEINTIVQTRFFIRALHKQIECLYEPPSGKFTLYRGQGLLYGDVQQLRTLKGGLYSFHNFLSTSVNREVALSFALSSRDDPDLTGVIFHINVDPASLKSALYAPLDNVSYYKKEKEVLFTMHTVFRVDEIKQLDDQLWQVELSLTNDDDKDLKKLAENIRQATQGSTGWDRLGQLLLKMEKFDKAEKVYNVLIKNSSKDDLKGLAHHYHLLGSVKLNRKDYESALIFYMKSLEIYQSLSNSNHLDFGTLYNDIGLVYQHKREYSKALTFHQTALDIQNKSSPLNHSDLVITYGNLAEVYKHMGDYPKSLEFYQKKLNIHKKSIPFNYLNLAITYENMAETHYNMKKYSKALKLFRKVSNIRQHRLHRNNIEIAITYNNIGKVYETIEQNIEAIASYQYARDILRKSAPVNFSKLAMTCNKIALIYKKMEEPLKALEFYRETIRNLDRSSNLNEINDALIHDNIGQIYENIGQYKEALLSYREAIRVERQSSSESDAQLQLYQKHLADLREKLKL
jgi:tetratricopeptide (TPR) repeat protein